MKRTLIPLLALLAAGPPGRLRGEDLLAGHRRALLVAQRRHPGGDRGQRRIRIPRRARPQSRAHFLRCEGLPAAYQWPPLLFRGCGGQAGEKGERGRDPDWRNACGARLARQRRLLRDATLQSRTGWWSNCGPWGDFEVNAPSADPLRRRAPPGPARCHSIFAGPPGLWRRLATQTYGLRRSARIRYPRDAPATGMQPRTEPAVKTSRPLTLRIRPRGQVIKRRARFADARPGPEDPARGPRSRPRRP